MRLPYLACLALFVAACAKPPPPAPPPPAATWVAPEPPPKIVRTVAAPLPLPEPVTAEPIKSPEARNATIARNDAATIRWICEASWQLRYYRGDPNTPKPECK